MTLRYLHHIAAGYNVGYVGTIFKQRQSLAARLRVAKEDSETSRDEAVQKALADLQVLNVLNFQGEMFFLHMFFWQETCREPMVLVNGCHLSSAMILV